MAAPNSMEVEVEQGLVCGGTVYGRDFSSPPISMQQEAEEGDAGLICLFFFFFLSFLPLLMDWYYNICSVSSFHS